MHSGFERSGDRAAKEYPLTKSSATFGIKIQPKSLATRLIIEPIEFWVSPKQNRS
jgi:hypothetical protein